MGEYRGETRAWDTAACQKWKFICAFRDSGETSGGCQRGDLYIGNLKASPRLINHDYAFCTLCLRDGAFPEAFRGAM